MKALTTVYNYIISSPGLKECCFYASVVLLLLLYRFLRRNKWRSILGRSIEYHRYHLAMLSSNKENNEKCRGLYQAMLWAVNKQLSEDLARSSGRGGLVLWRSFLGDKTCINTCGTVFYETARNYRFVDDTVVKLNDTLISTFYRVLLLESILSPVAVLYMDIHLLISMITKPAGGTGRLYREMLLEPRSGYKK